MRTWKTDSEDAPRVNLPHVETRLNMHQYNGLFEVSSPERQNGSANEPSDARTLSSSAQTNGESPHEWSSAVGHAATGKSSRVIHNLQEDIARLTRECSLYRSRAEETQRSNEALKVQLQNLTDRLRNAELSNETNLISIARKDRKIEQLRAEIQGEKDRRQHAEGETRKIHQLMAESKDDFNRKCAELQDITNHSRTQYDALAQATLREKADFQKKLDALRDEFDALRRQSDEKDIQLERLDAIMAQKNREIETGRERIDKLFEEYEAYKKAQDDAVRELIEQGHRNETIIDQALASLKETEGRMKWAIQVKKEVHDAK
ncbi:hypothetical protein VTN02DRAFT_1615 [Thermoascus thermophilus]